MNLPPSAAPLAAAAARLRGHLVATPVIGDLCLPGVAAPPGLRVKAELLQPGGLWFRGACHWLLRQMGRHKGIVCSSPPAAVAWAAAARATRMAAVVAVPHPEPALRQALAALDCRLVSTPRPEGDAAGFRPVPDASDPDFAAGVGTVVLELAAELPAATDRLVVSPCELAATVAAAAALLGLSWRVEAAKGVTGGEDLRDALRVHHRLCCSAEGARALAHALASPCDATCVVLS